MRSLLVVFSPLVVIGCASAEGTLWVPATEEGREMIAASPPTDEPVVAVDETADAEADTEGLTQETPPPFVPRTVGPVRDRIPTVVPETAVVDPSSPTQSRDQVLRNEFIQNQGRIETLSRDLRDYDLRGAAIGVNRPIGVGGTARLPPAVEYRESLERRNLEAQQRSILRQLNRPSATVNSINSARGRIAAPVGEGSSRALIRR